MKRESSSGFNSSAIASLPRGPSETRDEMGARNSPSIPMAIARRYLNTSELCFRLNPRPAGGGTESAPPLLDFLNNSKTVLDIDTKFGVPYSTSI